MAAIVAAMRHPDLKAVRWVIISFPNMAGPRHLRGGPAAVKRRAAQVTRRSTPRRRPALPRAARLRPCAA